MVPAICRGPRPPRSRRNRPCDSCRVRKVACKIAVEPPCEFCLEKDWACTFQQAPGPRKRRRPAETGAGGSGSGEEREGGMGKGHHVRSAVSLSPSRRRRRRLDSSSTTTSGGGWSAASSEGAWSGASSASSWGRGSPDPKKGMDSHDHDHDVNAVSDDVIVVSTSPLPQVKDLLSALDSEGGLKEEQGGAQTAPDKRLLLARHALRYSGLSGDLDPFLLAHRLRHDSRSNGNGHSNSRGQPQRHAGAAYYRMSEPLEGRRGQQRQLPSVFFTCEERPAWPETTHRETFSRLVDRMTVSRLVKLYMRFVHPYWPIISRHQLSGAFQARAGDDEDGADEATRYGPAYEENANMPLHLQSALCATAVPFLAMHRETALPLAEGLFALSEEILQRQQQDEGLAVSTLPDVQTLLLLLLRHPGRETGDRKKPVASADQRAWAQCSQLVAAAQMLGLHEDPAAWTALDAWEQRLRRRLWWAVWTTEKWLAFGLGMPSHLTAGGMTVQRDEEVKPEKEKTEKTKKTRDTDYSPHFAAMVELTAILDDMSGCFFATTAAAESTQLQASLEAAKAFRQRLKTWHQDLPAALRRTLERSRTAAALLVPVKVTAAAADAATSESIELNGDAALGMAFFTAQLAVFRALLRPLLSVHFSMHYRLQTSSAVPGGVSGVSPELATATLMGAIASLRDTLAFAEHLTPAEWDAFWPSWSRHNFSLASTLLRQCYLLTSPPDQTETASSSSALLPSATSALLFSDIRFLVQKWRWLLRLARQGDGQMNVLDAKLLTEWTADVM